MVKIISNGKNKTFYAKCFNCATDFEYQLSDTTTKELTDHLAKEMKVIECPVCNEANIAMLLTKEEQEKNFHQYPYGYCAI